MLFNEPKLLKFVAARGLDKFQRVSVLFNEPKLLKFPVAESVFGDHNSFSALQRAEIAEIRRNLTPAFTSQGFSALQRAEIAEIGRAYTWSSKENVSVLFNEPKLLKSPSRC